MSKYFFVLSLLTFFTVASTTPYFDSKFRIFLLNLIKMIFICPFIVRDFEFEEANDPVGKFQKKHFMCKYCVSRSDAGSGGCT